MVQVHALCVLWPLITCEPCAWLSGHIILPCRLGLVIFRKPCKCPLRWHYVPTITQYACTVYARRLDVLHVHFQVFFKKKNTFLFIFTSIPQHRTVPHAELLVYENSVIMRSGAQSLTAREKSIPRTLWGGRKGPIKQETWFSARRHFSIQMVFLSEIRSSILLFCECNDLDWLVFTRLGELMQLCARFIRYHNLSSTIQSRLYSYYVGGKAVRRLMGSWKWSSEFICVQYKTISPI